MKDNTDRLLKAINHIDNLPEKELEEILKSRESRDSYELLSKMSDAFYDAPQTDIDTEWKRFKQERIASAEPRRRFFLFRFVNRNVAAAVVCVVASIAVVAATIGIKYSIYSPNKKVIPEVTTSELSTAKPAATPTTVSDTISARTAPTGIQHTIVFKDEPLDKVITSIAESYGATVSFKTTSAKELNLYFQWDSALPLTEVVEQLNNFEQINISISGNNITVE